MPKYCIINHYYYFSFDKSVSHNLQNVYFYQNLKNQIMTTNLWVEQYWRDYKLQWDPEEYGGKEKDLF